MKNRNNLTVVKGEKRVAPLDGKNRYQESKLTPATLSGVVIPWSKVLKSGRVSNYKLVCSSGLEYSIASDKEWQDVFAWYSWEDVNVIGLLDLASMTLFPQRVFPKGPSGERENVIHLAAGRSKDFFKNIVKNINELVFVPAAVCAVMAL